MDKQILAALVWAHDRRRLSVSTSLRRENAVSTEHFYRDFACPEHGTLMGEVEPHLLQL
ncbi:MAG: hypothetical protein R2932_16930 [Caldilineaceae bacterium]